MNFVSWQGASPARARDSILSIQTRVALDLRRGQGAKDAFSGCFHQKKKNHWSTTATIGIANRKLSARSRMPPWPGRMEPESLT